jgi:hypothetical protein
MNGTDDAFLTLLERLKFFGSTIVDDNIAEEIASNPKFQHTAKRLCHLIDLFGLRKEIDEARALIDSDDPWSLLKSFVSFPAYFQLVRTEYQGANLKLGDRVVFLGSGPLPLSLVILYQEYGVESIGIEQVPEYAELSQKVIEVLGLNKHIRIVQGNHFLLPLREEHSLLMIGSDAIPKDEIFAYLAKVLPDGTKVFYRTIEKGGNSLRALAFFHSALPSTEPFRLPSEFKELHRFPPEPSVACTVVQVVKRTGNEAEGK